MLQAQSYRLKAACGARSAPRAWFRVAGRRRIPLPQNSQTFECQEFVHLLNELRSRPDQCGEPSRRNHFRGLSKFSGQSLQDTVHQSEITVIKARLQTADRGRANNSGRFADIHSLQAGSAAETSVGE